MASRSQAIWDWYRQKIPAEDRRRLGHISKQGNALLRFLLVEAAQVTVRSIPEWRLGSHPDSP